MLGRRIHTKLTEFRTTSSIDRPTLCIGTLVDPQSLNPYLTAMAVVEERSRKRRKVEDGTLFHDSSFTSAAQLRNLLQLSQKTTSEIKTGTTSPINDGTPSEPLQLLIGSRISCLESPKSNSGKSSSDN